jgi:hypothetical protein
VQHGAEGGEGGDGAVVAPAQRGGVLVECRLLAPPDAPAGLLVTVDLGLPSPDPAPSSDGDSSEEAGGGGRAVAAHASDGGARGHTQPRRHAPRAATPRLARPPRWASAAHK